MNELIHGKLDFHLRSGMTPVGSRFGTPRLAGLWSTSLILLGDLVKC